MTVWRSRYSSIWRPTTSRMLGTRIWGSSASYFEQLCLSEMLHKTWLNSEAISSPYPGTCSSPKMVDSGTVQMKNEYKTIVTTISRLERGFHDSDLGVRSERSWKWNRSLDRLVLEFKSLVLEIALTMPNWWICHVELGFQVRLPDGSSGFSRRGKEHESTELKNPQRIDKWRLDW